MSDLNQVVLVGRIGQDPELRTIPDSGDKMCSVGLANSTHKKVGDDWQEQTSWFDVSFFGRQAEQVCERARKGHRIAVTGRLKQRTWEDKEGNKRERVGVSANSVQFFEKKNTGAQGTDDGVPF